MNLNSIICIDDNHLMLIYALIISNKPKNVLELGIGSGKTTQTIINGFIYNQMPLSIDCVDNFYDWGGKSPDHIKDLYSLVNIINMSERTFITNSTKRYDFIISDADHSHAHLWIKETINLLNDNGILIYHDITNPSFPNLSDIIKYMNNFNYKYLLFNKNSLPNERCERGLLVIQKS